MNKVKTAVISAAAIAAVGAAVIAAVVGSNRTSTVDTAATAAPESTVSEAQATVPAGAGMSETSRLFVTEPGETTVPVLSTLPQSSTTALPVTVPGSSVPAGETEASAIASEPTTLQKIITTIKDTTKKPTAPANPSRCAPSDISSAFVLPKAKKYVSKYSNINFDKINLASYKYNAEGNYFYTDDKECWQDNFGYNLVYDKLAIVGHMYFDTIRTVFNYGGKQWLVQLWKGQYGYVFVGAEMGIYTREIGSKGAYKCAGKDDWIYMEMTCYWDQRDDGKFVPVFTRPYDTYWWCTGFVPGWLNDTSKCTELQLVGRLTFKDAEMARAFANALSRSGFDERSSYSRSGMDTFTVIGRDVVFNWWQLDDEQ